MSQVRSRDGGIEYNFMKLKEIAMILEAEIIAGADLLETDVEMACGCDLMSDVLSFMKSESLLLTGLTNPQVVRTAEMAEVACICFVRGKEPLQETVQLAEKRGIPLEKLKATPQNDILKEIVKVKEPVSRRGRKRKETNYGTSSIS